MIRVVVCSPSKNEGYPNNNNNNNPICKAPECHKTSVALEFLSYLENELKQSPK